MVQGIPTAVFNDISGSTIGLADGTFFADGFLKPDGSVAGSIDSIKSLAVNDINGAIVGLADGTFFADGFLKPDGSGVF